MRVALWLLLFFLSGCSSDGTEPTALLTPPVKAPTVSTAFRDIHEHLHRRVLPAFRQLYEKGSHQLRSDAAVASRQKAARQFYVAFGQGLDELKRIDGVLVKQKPGSAKFEAYKRATSDQIVAWRNEAVVYRAFVKCLTLPDPNQDPHLAEAISKLEATAQARLASTAEGQQVFDEVFGPDYKGLTRPATVSHF